MVLYSAFKSNSNSIVRKPVKGKGGKGKGKRAPLTGPNGEPADDETCWDMKETGLCPRFPCKWSPCADLPEDDIIFEGAKKIEPRKGKKGKGKGKVFTRKF